MRWIILLSLLMMSACENPRVGPMAEPLDVGPYGQLDMGDAWIPPPDVGMADTAAAQARLFGAREIIQVEIELSEISYNQLVAEPRRGYVPAQITIDGQVFPRVGLKLKGGRGSFRKITQKAAFKIELDRFDSSRHLHGLRKLTFNNMIQDYTKMRERLTSLMFERFGVPAPRVGYVEITVDGRLYGLYAHIETIDRGFVDRVFPGSEGDLLYEGSNDLDLWMRDVDEMDHDLGDDPGRARLKSLIRTIDRATPLSFDEVLGDTLHLDHLRRFLAAEVMVGHWDGYGQLRNNYYLYQRTDGRWMFFPSGTDQAFQRTRNAFSGPGRLMRMCSDWHVCRVPYAEMIETLAERMESVDWNSEIDVLKALTEEAFLRDPRTPTREAQWVSGLEGLRRFIYEHPQRIRDSLSCLEIDGQDADGDGVLTCAGDCNDNNPSIYRGANDTCDDEIDQDCSGFTDDGQYCPECRAFTEPVGGADFLLCHRPERIGLSRATCDSYGGKVASIRNQAEQDAVFAAAMDREPTRWWIGLIDFRSEGDYVWLDEAPLEYENYGEGEPNNNGGYEDCTCMSRGGQWNDIYCGTYLPTVCRLP